MENTPFTNPMPNKFNREKLFSIAANENVVIRVIDIYEPPVEKAKRYESAFQQLRDVDIDVAPFKLVVGPDEFESEINLYVVTDIIEGKNLEAYCYAPEIEKQERVTTIQTLLLKMIAFIRNVYVNGGDYPTDVHINQFIVSEKTGAPTFIDLDDYTAQFDPDNQDEGREAFCELVFDLAENISDAEKFLDTWLRQPREALRTFIDTLPNTYMNETYVQKAKRILTDV